MTYREAKAIALAHSRKVTACLEYEEGYRFFEKDALQKTATRLFYVICDWFQTFSDPWLPV